MGKNPVLSWNLLSSVRGAKQTAYRCAVPANTTATPVLPAENLDDVAEGGKPLSEAQGVSVVSENAGTIVLLLENGSYDFTISPASARTGAD